ncbi:MAG TPA: GNAT family N-acetyltransferase [Bryobacteraceae bacterium]|nr:GNAT family N-acetyltransferase [Bryobacteraceae bacterium]
MSEPASARSAGIQLIEPKPEHISELGRICYEAFKDIADQHHFPPDFPSAQHARFVMGMLVNRPDFYAVAATVDGELAGSNFLSLSDEVAGLGPITVDCAFQGRDLGRKLMQAVIDYARAHNIQRVRLLQDGFNTLSISLYGSLGFDTKHAVAYLHLAPAAQPDPSVRPVEPRDLDALDALCQRNYKSSRRNELAAALQAGFSPFTRQRDGRLTGYLIPGVFGHGVAETDADAAAIACQAARLLPPDRAYCFCPLDQGSTFRAFLQAGCRTVKIMNLMAMGPYEQPQPVWMPSVLY